jgi:heavy metal sensor kinase
MLRSIRVRLTLWYVLLLAVILAVFSGGVYFALRWSLYNNLEDALDTRADTLFGVITVEDGVPTLDPLQAPADPQGEHFVRVFDPGADLTFDNTDGNSVTIDQAAVAAALRGAASVESEDWNGDGVRVLTTPIRRDSDIVGVLQVGQSDEDVLDTLQVLLIIIAVAYPLTLIVTSAGGAFLASRALAPIDRLTQVARQISAEDLSRRLDMKLPDDEVGRLAQTFNDMIARLDEAFRRQRQFTADASHELRTPLTALKGQAEVALQREREPVEYREVLASVNAQVDRMIRLVGSLLTLARADAGQMTIAREAVDLGQLVADAAEQLTPVAHEKGVEMEVQAGPRIRLLADEDLLLQLTLNLLDNAVKYTPVGGIVGVAWALENGSAVLRVSDTGPGIPREHLPHVFDRFYRVDASRGASAGAGLGLSISKWIAEVHGGTIAVESASGRGSTFIVRLPLASS